MRYRRLGRTEWMVSELGLTARGLEDLPVEEAEAVLRAAFDAGVSLVAIDVRDELPDLEGLIGRIAGSDRPRMTMVSVLSTAPPSEALAPAVEAAAVRLGGDGTLDAIAVPGTIGAAHLEALDQLKERGVVRAAGIATADPAVATEAIEAGWVDVLVAPLNVPQRIAMRPAFAVATRHDVGVVLAGRVVGAEAGALVAWGLSEPGAHAVAAGPASAPGVEELVLAAGRAPLDAAHIDSLEAAVDR